MIIYIDEADKLLLDHQTGDYWKQVFLRLFDDSTQHVLLSEFGFEFNISRVIWVLSGNADSSKFSRDIQSRMEQIRLNPLSEEQKT